MDQIISKVDKKSQRTQGNFSFNEHLLMVMDEHGKILWNQRKWIAQCLFCIP